MLKKLLKHKIQILIFIVLVLFLALVRAFETKLFYDPFLAFFKSEFNNHPLPEFDTYRLFFSMFFRYFLNTIFSLGIIYTIFKNIELVKFASILYGIFFLLLIIAFFLIIYFYGEHNNLVLFYVRRFLIQPLFVLLFVPAFYYQEQLSSKQA